jgi:thiol-disulfide isomerase/thioredoxin
MKRYRLRNLLVAAAVLVSAPSTTKASLAVGDPAPALRAGTWIQGEPVNAFDSNHVYIVEFWATWCGPCRASIPHLNELWQQFKDKGVIVIGVDVWDSDDAVAPFVKKMGDKMTYRVALDDKSQDAEGFMADNWWKRHVDGHSIPHAFIIDQQGRIAWIGHPMELNEKLINDIVSGHYDLAEAATEYAEYKQQLVVDQKISVINDRLSSAINAKRWDDAAAALADALKIAPKREDDYANARMTILLGQKRFDEAYQFAASYSDNHPLDTFQLSQIAFAISLQPDVKPPQLALAEKLAQRANTAANGKDVPALNTLARIQFMEGKSAEAIATAQKAVDAAPAPEKRFSAMFLADYQQGKLP